MKLISWNVNGLRACIFKGFSDFFNGVGADMFCVQETKMQSDQMMVHFDGYSEFWNSALKKGYAGTAIFTRIPPLSVSYDIGVEEHAGEGRAIMLEFEDFYLVNAYTPNAQEGLTRLDYRMRWEDDFLSYLKALDAAKPVVLCGDLNVAHTELDIKNAKSNVGNAGFTPEERDKMTELLRSGFVDTFRYLHPGERGAYTWWSYMFNARANNAGWRIDYFIVSDRLKGRVKDSFMHPDVIGSDHCPIELLIFE
jgi:exodeoxyribonuclease-3